MKIKIATKAGFCFGVKRAVDLAIETSETSEHLYTLGQLIHNDQVTTRLKEHGVTVIDGLESIDSGEVIIRSHGVGKSVYQEASARHLNVLDATCPFVKKVHKIVDEHYNNGYEIIIIGDKDHPEIIGINGWCDHTGIIAKTFEELPDTLNGHYCLVAQTTLKQETWEQVVDVLTKKNVDFVGFNTICSATAERQSAAMALAREADLMIVIGGYHSSNTKKLYEICASLCKETVHVEKKSDLVVTNYKKYDIIGITAGASTPDWVIQEIVDYLKNPSE